MKRKPCRSLSFWVCAVVVDFIVLLAPPGACRAEFMVGSQVFESTGILSLPNESDISDTTFLFNAVTLLGGNHQVGDTVGTLGAFTNFMDTNNLADFELGSELYGRFVVQHVGHNSLIPDVSRTIELSGFFSPGVLTFGSSFERTPARVTIVITQSALTRGELLYSSILLATTEAPGAATLTRERTAATPEPSTVVHALIFLVIAGCAFVFIIAPRDDGLDASHGSTAE